MTLDEIWYEKYIFTTTKSHNLTILDLFVGLCDMVFPCHLYTMMYTVYHVGTLQGIKVVLIRLPKLLEWSNAMIKGNFSVLRP